MFRRIVLTFASICIPVMATAQPLGTYRWQLQPYCNVLSVAVTQNGSTYRLEGTDDQCGAAKQGSALGMAFPNPDGTIGFGLNGQAGVPSRGQHGGHVDADRPSSHQRRSGRAADHYGGRGRLTFETVRGFLRRQRGEVENLHPRRRGSNGERLVQRAGDQAVT